MQSNFLGLRDGQETTEDQRAEKGSTLVTDSNKATNLITNCTSTEPEAKCSQKSRALTGTEKHSKSSPC